MTDFSSQLWAVVEGLQAVYHQALESNDPRLAEIDASLQAANRAYELSLIRKSQDLAGALNEGREKLRQFSRRASNWPFDLGQAPQDHERPNRDEDEKEPIVRTPIGAKLPSGKAHTSREKEYLDLWDTMTINSAWKGQAVEIAKKVIANQTRYRAVVAGSAIPWWFVAIVHSMECSLRFDQHLHNGDPLLARTVRIPAKRPASGFPPFTWEDSAKDALEYDDIDKVTDWSLPNVLYLWHRYNGIDNEYRKRGIPTPYLWSGTQHYKKGKYVRDKQFDPSEVSGQVGAATLLKTLVELKAVVVENNAVETNVNGGVKTGHGAEQKSATVAPA